MVEFTKTLKVGDGFEDGVFLGPVQNSSQYDRVQVFFDDIEKQGSKIAVGGKSADSNGYFIYPAIIDNPKEDSRIVVEEPDDIARANDTKMGFGASVWSSDLEEAERISKRLEAGSVWVNARIEIGPNIPIGGHEESGIGTEWGQVGLKYFCNSQTMYLAKKV